ncbi:hypothetical protein [Halorarius halobius]|uniref:hypothetical protein n=1 Tax=Halorarius halobius TaxID=2962671 RepID=UPI0020CC6370|nr:hypothetical protein [Halorarius halobius]
MVYATAGLVDALLDIAESRDPQEVTVALATRPAGEIDCDLPAETPVYTDFYLPDTGRSVRAVFGMDLGTPGSQGRFVSHPSGDPKLSRTDDLHEVVLVAVPPYDRDSLRAFDRSGRRLDLQILDVEPPEATLEEPP